MALRTGLATGVPFFVRGWPSQGGNRCECGRSPWHRRRPWLVSAQRRAARSTACGQRCGQWEGQPAHRLSRGAALGGSAVFAGCYGVGASAQQGAGQRPCWPRSAATVGGWLQRFSLTRRNIFVQRCSAVADQLTERRAERPETRSKGRKEPREQLW